MSTTPQKNLVFALIIEDDPHSARLYGRILKSLNIPFDTAASTKAGLDQLSIVVPELVLLDLNLANVSGAEILKFIRTDPHYADTRVIIITAYSQLYDTMRDRADHIFLKPVNVRELTQVIQALVPIPQP